MATITTNHIYDPYDQWFTLNYSFANGAFSWSVISHSNNGGYRTDIYGLTVSIGGKTYSRTKIAYGDYTPGSVILSGTTNLSECNISNGIVAISISGNYYNGTWDPTHRASGSGSMPIVLPEVEAPTYTISNGYNGNIVSGISNLIFSMQATPGSEGTTISAYKLYIDGVQVYSGSAASCTVKAPTSAGNHTAYVIAVESNGASGQSTNITFTTLSYTYPSFNSVTSVRWSSGSSSGVASDDGTYAKLSADYNASKIGNTSLTTRCKMQISSFEGVVDASGSVLYTGNILSVDLSYTVIYKLYDDYLGEANAIIRADTISIGGRAFDLIHDASDGYGAAFGKKAVAGKLDTALPLRIVNIDASGNITEEADVNATPASQSSIITRTSGLAIQAQTLKTWGRVATLTLVMNGDGAYHNTGGGNNLFVGTLNGFVPATSVMGVGYYDDVVYVGWIQGNTITIRSDKGFTPGSGNPLYISWTYLF